MIQPVSRASINDGEARHLFISTEWHKYIHWGKTSNDWLRHSHPWWWNSPSTELHMMIDHVKQMKYITLVSRASNQLVVSRATSRLPLASITLFNQWCITPLSFSIQRHVSCTWGQLCLAYLPVRLCYSTCCHEGWCHAPAHNRQGINVLYYWRDNLKECFEDNKTHAFDYITYCVVLPKWVFLTNRSSRCYCDGF